MRHRGKSFDRHLTPLLEVEPSVRAAAAARMPTVYELVCFLVCFPASFMSSLEHVPRLGGAGCQRRVFCLRSERPRSPQNGHTRHGVYAVRRNTVTGPAALAGRVWEITPSQMGSTANMIHNLWLRSVADIQAFQGTRCC